MAADKKSILDSLVIEKKLERLALEVIENNIEEAELILVGISNKGLVVAKNIQKLIAAHCSIQTQLLTLSLDKKKPDTIMLSKSLDFDDKVIVLIDDVTNSGKTLLYAMKPFLEFQPKKIQILVLVERSHTAFPISADYKGLSLATTFQENITVEVQGAKITGAYLD